VRLSVYFSVEPRRSPLKIILLSVRASVTQRCIPHMLSAVSALILAYPVPQARKSEKEGAQLPATLASYWLHLIVDTKEAL
jgi:hypothetical protein